MSIAVVNPVSPREMENPYERAASLYKQLKREDSGMSSRELAEQIAARGEITLAIAAAIVASANVSKRR